MGLIPEREWVEIDVPQTNDAGEVVGHVKERVVRWQTYAAQRRKTMGAFVAVFLAATGAAYLGYAAGNSSDQGLAQNAREAVKQSCLDRADGRITVALGFDQLRFAAIRRPKTPAQRRAVERFLASTQKPINALLNQAAFSTEGRNGAPVISSRGVLTTRKGKDAPELARARSLAGRRCNADAAKFNGKRIFGG